MSEVIGVSLQVDSGNLDQTVADLRKNLADAVNEATRIKAQFGEASAQFKAAQDNVAAVSKSLQDASKNAKGLGDNVGAADAPIKGMRARLREATEEMIRLQEQFGELSPQALAAARDVAGLRDQIQEANEVAGLFDPGKSFQSIVGVTSAIAAGFSAAQGAMALFGVESKEVEKALLKVQAAMALSQSLSTVKDSIKDFQRLGAMLGQITIVQKANAVANTLAAGTMRAFGVATTQTGVAFNFLRGAILATGIGALVVLLGTAIQYMVDFANKTKIAADEQKKMADAVREGQDELKNSLLKGNKEAEALAVARAKAAGKSEAEITEIHRRAAEDRISILRDNMTRQEGDNKKFNEAQAALISEQNEQEIKGLEARAKVREEAEKKAKEASDKAAAKRKSDQEKADQLRKQHNGAANAAAQQTADEVYKIQHSAEENELYDLAQKFKKRIEEYTKAGRNTKELIEAQEIEAAAIREKFANAAKLKEDEARRDKEEKEAKLLGTQLQNLADFHGKKVSDYDRQLLELEAFHATLLADTTITNDQRKELERDYTKTHKDLADARTEISTREMKARMATAQATADLLSGFAELAGEQTAAGKVLAIASTTISTIVGAQAAFTGMVQTFPGPWGIAAGVIAAAGAVASGIANVRKIAQVQVPGKGGGGTPSITGGTAPMSPAAPTATTTQLNQNSINSLQNATVKAIVVESDITNSQERINRIHNQARLE